MRVALVTQWLRVARHFPELRAPSAALRRRGHRRATAVDRASWRRRRSGRRSCSSCSAAPSWRCRSGPSGRNRGSRYWRLFHPEHIEERYGLFTIIVLGETLLSATVGIREVAQEGVSAGLIIVAVGGLLLAFGAWWLYFDHPGHLTPSPVLAMRWGFLHVIVFTSLAALGAGLYVAAEAVAGHATARIGALAVAIPVAGFLVGLVMLMLLTHHAVRPSSIGPKVLGAALVVVVGMVASVTVTVVVAAVTMVVMVVLMVVSGPPARTPAAAR